jgi:hypothetical protein
VSVAVRRSLYGKLSGDTTLNGLLAAAPASYTKSIYYGIAPQGAAFPFVIFSKQASTPYYALSERALDNDVWLIKGVDRSESADTVDAIASRLDALLTDGTISISGRTQLYLRRESDVDYSEEADGVAYRHAGSLFRLMYE